MKYWDPSGETVTWEEWNQAVTKGLNSPYGGSWTPETGFEPFSSDGAGFEVGAAYNDKFNSWNLTGAGNRNQAEDNYVASGGILLQPIVLKNPVRKGGNKDGQWKDKWQQFKDGILNDFTIFAMTSEWIIGVNQSHVFINDRVTQDLSRSPGIKYARNLYYTQGKIEGYAPFGKEGFYNSGLNPFAQFVGGFNYQISVEGDNLIYFVTNNTTIHSLMLDKTPQSWNTDAGPLSTMTQYYIFKESIRK